MWYFTLPIMKKFFRNTGATLLALMVLLSTFSFTVDKHFCGKLLVDAAVFSEAHSCGMDMENDAMAGMDEDSCCKDQKIQIDGQDELKRSFDDLDFQKQLFVTSFTYSYFNLFEILPGREIPFQDYSPPLLVTDIQLLDQVFII